MKIGTGVNAVGGVSGSYSIGGERFEIEFRMNGENSPSWDCYWKYFSLVTAGDNKRHMKPSEVSINGRSHLTGRLPSWLQVVRRCVVSLMRPSAIDKGRAFSGGVHVCV